MAAASPVAAQRYSGGAVQISPLYYFYKQLAWVTLGLPVMQVEAMAFAWLAHQMVTRTALDLPSTTGALGARVLGAMYPA